MRSLLVVPMIALATAAQIGSAQSPKKNAAPAQRGCATGCWKGSVTVEGRTIPLEGSAVLEDLEDYDGRHIKIALNKRWLQDETEGVDASIMISRSDDRVMPPAGTYITGDGCGGKTLPHMMVVSTSLSAEDAPLYRSLDGNSRKGEVTLTTVTRTRVTGAVKFEGCADLYDADGKLVKRRVPLAGTATFDARVRR